MGANSAGPDGAAHSPEGCRAREVLDLVADKWSLYVVSSLGPGSRRRRPYRRFPPSTCRPFIRPNGPWPKPCSACLPPGVTGCRRSPRWTRHGAGVAARPDRFLARRRAGGGGAAHAAGLVKDSATVAASPAEAVSGAGILTLVSS
jgi:hypothetical protein